MHNRYEYEETPLEERDGCGKLIFWILIVAFVLFLFGRTLQKFFL